jgi:hypothetical protein
MNITCCVMIQYPRLRWGRTPAGNKWAAHLQSCFESIVNPVGKMHDGRNCPLPPVLVKRRSLVRGMRQSPFFRIFNNLAIFVVPVYIHNTCCFAQRCAAYLRICLRVETCSSERDVSWFFSVSSEKFWESTSGFGSYAFTRFLLNT